MRTVGARQPGTLTVQLRQPPALPWHLPVALALLATYMSTGIVEPIKAGVEAGVRLGVGKQEQDNFFTDAEGIERRKLEVEIQANEDPERARKREVRLSSGSGLPVCVITMCMGGGAWQGVRLTWPLLRLSHHLVSSPPSGARRA